MNLTLNEAYKDYLKYVSLKQKPQSVRTIERRFKNHIIPFFDFDNIKTNLIDEKDFLEWQ